MIDLTLDFSERAAKMIREDRFREAKEAVDAYFAFKMLVRELSENVEAGRYRHQILLHVAGLLGIKPEETIQWLVKIETMKQIRESSPA